MLSIKNTVKNRRFSIEKMEARTMFAALAGVDSSVSHSESVRTAEVAPELGNGSSESGGAFSKFSHVAFNPQPEPPKASSRGFDSGLSRVGFNPQPEPPRGLDFNIPG